MTEQRRVSIGDGFRFGLGLMLAQVLWLPLLLVVATVVVLVAEKFGGMPTWLPK